MLPSSLKQANCLSRMHFFLSLFPIVFTILLQCILHINIQNKTVVTQCPAIRLQFELAECQITKSPLRNEFIRPSLDLGCIYTFQGLSVNRLALVHKLYRFQSSEKCPSRMGRPWMISTSTFCVSLAGSSKRVPSICGGFGFRKWIPPADIARRLRRLI